MNVINGVAKAKVTANNPVDDRIRIAYFFAAFYCIFSIFLQLVFPLVIIKLGNTSIEIDYFGNKTGDASFFDLVSYDSGFGIYLLVLASILLIMLLISAFLTFNRILTYATFILAALVFSLDQINREFVASSIVTHAIAAMDVRVSSLINIFSWGYIFAMLAAFSALITTSKRKLGVTDEASKNIPAA